jgi:hypothetical protein
MTLQTDDVMIASEARRVANEGGRSLGKNAHRMRLAAAVGETRCEIPAPRPPQAATLSHAIVARNTNSHVSARMRTPRPFPKPTCHRSSSVRVKAHGVALSLRAIARLGEDQEWGLASCEPGAVAAFRKALTCNQCFHTSLAAETARMIASTTLSASLGAHAAM